MMKFYYLALTTVIREYEGYGQLWYLFGDGTPTSSIYHTNIFNKKLAYYYFIGHTNLLKLTIRINIYHRAFEIRRKDLNPIQVSFHNINHKISTNF